jgi:uncharacterized protein
MLLQRKFARLKRIISGYRSCVVAFSGGVDSALLLKVCSLVLPEKDILALTAVSATYPGGELAKARLLAREIGVRLKVVRTFELGKVDFSRNSARRCYFCKKELFSRLASIAKSKKLKFILEGSNASDKEDYRPGDAAKKELGIKSPLLEAGLRKQDVRILSKKLGLPSWDKPSLACLASRIPYGIKITPVILRRIDRAERYLTGIGVKQARLRHYGSLCRIEADARSAARILRKRLEIVNRLKRLGYSYITLDLEGYRTGSLNEVINR